MFAVACLYSGICLSAARRLRGTARLLVCLALLVFCDCLCAHCLMLPTTAAFAYRGATPDVSPALIIHPLMQRVPQPPTPLGLAPPPPGPSSSWRPTGAHDFSTFFPTRCLHVCVVCCLLPACLLMSDAAACCAEEARRCCLPAAPCLFWAGDLHTSVCCLRTYTVCLSLLFAACCLPVLKCLDDVLIYLVFFDCLYLS